MKNKGQNLIEFGIIVVLVSFAGIIVLMVLGDNINAMLSSSHIKFKEFKPFGDPVSSTASPTGGNPVVTPPGNVAVPTDPVTPPSGGGDFEVNSVPVNINPDGSASFNINGQDVSIPAGAMADLNVVFETAGSSGLSTEVMAAIQKLIIDHQSEYPGTEVPINLDFGTGRRQGSSTYPGTYEGNATYNQVTVAVGEHKIIVQKDQSQLNGDDDLKGTHSIEIINNVGTVSSSVGSLNGDIINFPPGQIGALNGNSPTTGFAWDFQFPGNNVSL